MDRAEDPDRIVVARQRREGKIITDQVEAHPVAQPLETGNATDHGEVVGDNVGEGPGGALGGKTQTVEAQPGTQLENLAAAEMVGIERPQPADLADVAASRHG